MNHARKSDRTSSAASRILRATLAAFMTLLLCMPGSISFDSMDAWADEACPTEESYPKPSDYIASAADEDMVEIEFDKGWSLLGITGREDRPILNQTGHFLYVKHLMVDEAGIRKGETIDSLYESEERAANAIIGMFSESVALYDPGADDEYFVALANCAAMTSDVLSLDAQFALFDMMGHTVAGPVFDTGSGLAYIPKSLYFDDDGNELDFVLQCEIMCSTDFEKSSSHKVDVHVSNPNWGIASIEAQTVDVPSYSNTLTVPIMEAAKASSVDLADLSVRINGNENAIDLEADEAASYDKATGELTISASPITVFSVDVEVADKGFVANLLDTASAATKVTSTKSLKQFPVTFDKLNLDTLDAGDLFKIENWIRYADYTQMTTDERKMFGAVRSFNRTYLYSAASEVAEAYNIIANNAASKSKWSSLSSACNIYNLYDYMRDTQSSDSADLFGSNVSEVSANRGYADTYFIMNGIYDWSGGKRVYSFKDKNGDKQNFKPKSYWPKQYDSDEFSNKDAFWGWLSLQCSHVSASVAIGQGSGSDRAKGDIWIRVLDINKDEGYIVLGFVTAETHTQSGCGVYKFGIEKSLHGRITVEKRDVQTGSSPQGDASFAGTSFEIRNASASPIEFDGKPVQTGQLVTTLTIPAGATSDSTPPRSLPEGIYSVQETISSDGYRLTDGTPRVVSIETDGQEVSLAGTTSFKNAVKTGRARATKSDAETGNQSAQGDASLAGTRFQIANKSAKPVVVDNVTYPNGAVCATLVTDASGNTPFVELPYGTYEMKEVQASEGYALSDTAPRTFTIRTDGQTVSLPFSNPPIRGGLLLEKRDAETRESRALGMATLENTKFEIRNASRSPVKVDGLTFNPGEVCCTLSTDASGKASTGIKALPFGTYTIKEISASEGYLLTDALTRTFRIRSDGQVLAYSRNDISDTTRIGDAFYNQVMREDVSLVKVRGYDQKRLGGIPFSITNKLTGESHVIVTDGNGNASTEASWNRHTYKTNYNDSRRDGEYDDGAGVWWGKDGLGNASPPDDSLCALPYGEYVLEELPVFANRNFTLVKDEVVVHRNGITIDLKTITNGTGSEPSISTTATNAFDGGKCIQADEECEINDHVTFAGLEAGESYLLHATLFDPAEKKPVEGAEGWTEFTARQANGTTEVSIPCNLALFGGKDVVVHEELIKDGGIVAEHKEDTDSAQTVHVISPRISTTAVDSADGNKLVSICTDACIVDKVAYRNLTPGRLYTISATLMRHSLDEEGEPRVAVFEDPGGAKCTNSLEFSPDATDGSIEVPLAFDASSLSDGDMLVVYERLSRNGREIACHADPQDAAQSITIESPCISTTAHDATDGDRSVSADRNVRITDTVEYTGLVVGHEYTIEGSLQAKGLEGMEPLLDDHGEPVCAKASFVAKDTYGAVDVEFTLDAIKLAGADAVVFEKLYEKGELIASHEDPEDERQSISFCGTRINSLAVDALDGDKVLSADEDAKVDDTVWLDNLVPGNEYTVYGFLYDAFSQTPVTEGEKSGTRDLNDAWTSILNTFGLSPSNVFQGEDPLPQKQVESLLEDLSGSEDSESSVRKVLDANIAPASEYAPPEIGAQFSEEELEKAMARHSDAIEGMAWGSSTFVAKDSEEEVEIGYEVNADGNSTKAVVLDILVSGDRLVACHLDASYEGQSVVLSSPSIRTKASDATDGDKAILPSTEARISDLVSYQSLEAGSEYVLKGIVMDKSTGRKLSIGDKNVASQKSFTPNKSNGSTELEFQLDASKIPDGTSLVIFEELYKNGNLIASHRNISDESQTVMVSRSSYPPAGGYAKTGGGWREIWTMSMLLAGAAMVCGTKGASRLRAAGNQSR